MKDQSKIYTWYAVPALAEGTVQISLFEVTNYVGTWMELIKQDDWWVKLSP